MCNLSIAVQTSSLRTVELKGYCSNWIPTFDTNSIVGRSYFCLDRDLVVEGAKLFFAITRFLFWKVQSILVFHNFHVRK
jgi:hypothetical protein